MSNVTMFLSIWNSFRRLPLWVQAWMMFLLVPVNMASLFFLGEYMGEWVALLAVGGMAPNIFIMLYERGMSKLMALPHVIAWTPLCLLASWLLWESYSGRLELGLSYSYFLIALLAVNIFSLMFDFPDSWKWYTGDRAIV